MIKPVRQQIHLYTSLFPNEMLATHSSKAKLHPQLHPQGNLHDRLCPLAPHPLEFQLMVGWQKYIHGFAGKEAEPAGLEVYCQQRGRGACQIPCHPNVPSSHGRS